MKNSTLVLKVLATWLQEEDTCLPEGSIERQIHQAKQDTKREIGDMLDEIMEMSREQQLHNIGLSAAAKILFEMERDSEGGFSESFIAAVKACGSELALVHGVFIAHQAGDTFNDLLTRANL